MVEIMADGCGEFLDITPSCRTAKVFVPPIYYHQIVIVGMNDSVRSLVLSMDDFIMLGDGLTGKLLDDTVLLDEDEKQPLRNLKCGHAWADAGVESTLPKNLSRNFSVFSLSTLI